MSDVSHTGTSAVPVSGANNAFQDVVWGEAVTGFMPVYQHTDGKYYKALCDTAAHANVVGFACSAGAANQRGQIQTSGKCTLSGGLTTGVTYYVSDNAGGLGIIGDRGTGDYQTILGAALSSTVFEINIKAFGVAL